MSVFMGRKLRNLKSAIDSQVTNKFTEQFLRAKAGSNADSLERAQQLLTDASAETTKRIYRRKVEMVG